MSNKQKKIDRNRVFQGKKMQDNISRILEMRLDPLFETKITNDDVTNFEYLEQEWARYQAYLPSKAALMASFHFLAPRETHGMVYTPSVHLPDSAPNLRVDVECTLKGEKVNKEQYFYNNKSSSYLDKYYHEGLELPPYSGDHKTSSGCVDPELVPGGPPVIHDLSSNVDEQVISALESAIETDAPSTTSTSGTRLIEVLRQVGNIMSTNNYASAATIASLSVAINTALIPPRFSASSVTKIEGTNMSRLTSTRGLVEEKAEIKFWAYDYLVKSFYNPLFAKWFYLMYNIMERSYKLSHPYFIPGRFI